MPSATSDPLLRAEGIVRRYPSAAGPIEVLKGLDLEVRSGEKVAVVGDSGVGKSTLLHVLGGLDRPQAGRIAFEGRDVLRSSPSALAEYRNRSVGFIFQFHYLLPEFTAIENVEMPFHVGRRSSEASRARDVLARLGLEERLHHRPAALSGGEQQRVAIARAIATGPRLVLADEPTGNLDPRTGDAVFRLLRDLQTDYGFALIVATHSGRLARGCDRILRLEDGALRSLDDAEANVFFEGAS